MRPSSDTEKARTESRRLWNPKRRSFAASMRTLQTEIEKGLTANTPTQTNLQDITNRITEIDRKFADLLRTVSIGNDSAHDAELEALMKEKNDLRQRL